MAPESADASVRVMILTGAGTVFSSGGNVKDMKRFTGDAVSSAEIVQRWEGVAGCALAS